MDRGVSCGALLAALLVAGCQTTAARQETIRLCDDSGCYDAPASTATYDPNSAVPDQDPNNILPILVPEAERDPRAAYDLAMRYMRGDGLMQNSWEAIKWMRSAGERNYLPAQSALGRLYLTGLEETGPDYNEAQRWLSVAAARGDTEAGTLLAEAEAGRASNQAYQRYIDSWRLQYTRPYWFGRPYYGYWRGDRYRYY